MNPFLFLYLDLILVPRLSAVPEEILLNMAMPETERYYRTREPFAKNNGENFVKK